ncbi:MAG: radical SAM protein [Candidatus Omnitrophica bacterium]|nr:radical SAM protein [Candidatus Omnitrophota bacterium]
MKSFQNIHSACIEITYRCNLKCQHCIIHLSKRKSDIYISMSDFKDCVTFLREKGCRVIMLSGGEPMLHPQFKDIYLLLKKEGFGIVLFTNGTFLNSEWLDFFKKYPIGRLVITLYGSSDDEYASDSFSGEKNIFTNICETLKALPQSGIRYVVQARVSKHRKDVHDNLLRIFGNTLNMPKATLVYPRSLHDTENTEYMLSADEIVGEVNDKRLRERYRSLTTDPFRNETGKAKYHIGCGAGHGSIHITPDLYVMICAFYRKLSFSLKQYTFDDIFHIHLRSALQEVMSIESPCYNCSMNKCCSRCPAMGYGSVGKNAFRDILCNNARMFMQAGDSEKYLAEDANSTSNCNFINE